MPRLPALLLLLAALPGPATAAAPAQRSAPAQRLARAPAAPATAPAAPASPLRVQPARARPGDPVLVTVRGGAEAPTGTLAGRPLQFHAVPGGHQALAALPVELSPGELEVTVVPAGGAPLQSSLRVEDPKWRTRELKVAREFTEPSPELKARMDEDRAAFARAFAQPPGAPLFSGEFAWPRKAALTGRFGDRRTFNGQTQTQHYGLDIDGDEGDPIATANDGVVVMVRECFASGNTVVVHHGAGLYTAYFHLTEFRVQEGQRVARGEVVGTLGKTGRVTGAHLHWSVKVGELYVNPESLMRLRFF